MVAASDVRRWHRVQQRLWILEASGEIVKPTEPFHPGELKIQRLVGEEATAKMNGRGISPRVPGAARAFVGKQDLVILGTEDAGKQLWATLVTGTSGFAHVSDDLAHVHVDMHHPTGVLSVAPSLKDLHPSQPIAMLFIELTTRRRLRVNGSLTAVAASALEVHVAQAYAACPKYIQRRQIADQAAIETPIMATGTALTAPLISLFENADTLFIATAGVDGLLDVSHRGGRRGFAELRDGKIRIPDFAGNSMFNTLGNLALDDRAGLCIPDFERSCQWLLTGRAVVRFDVSDSPDKTGGTRRWIEFVPTAWALLPLNVPRTWNFIDSSPFNP